MQEKLADYFRTIVENRAIFHVAQVSSNCRTYLLDGGDTMGSTCWIEETQWGRAVALLKCHLTAGHTCLMEETQWGRAGTHGGSNSV